MAANYLDLPTLDLPYSYGVYGSDTNVDTNQADHPTYGVYGASEEGTGSYGTTAADAQSGVAGVDTSTGGGHGVYGKSTHGIGVLASSTKGTALEVKGPVRFSTSGVARVPAGARKATVTLAGVTHTSLILATPQAEAAGIYVGSAVPAKGSFTINLSGTVTTALDVAWFVIG